MERDELTLISLAGEPARIRPLMKRYAESPMDFAAAGVVQLAELHSDSAVCTTDSHFQFFRKHGREPVNLLSPKK